MWIKTIVLAGCVLAALAADKQPKKKEDPRGKRNLQYNIAHHYNGPHAYRLERRISTGPQIPLYHSQFFPGPRSYSPYHKGRPHSLPPPPYAVQMEPLVHYSQRDPLYDTNSLSLNTDGQDDLLTDNNHLSENTYGPKKHVIERPVYIKELEPIIEIIIKESNVTLPPPPAPPTPPPKKKEQVQVFYVKYKKNPNGHGKDSVIYDKPIAAISPQIEDEQEEAPPPAHHHQEVVTSPPPPSTTLRTIIRPDSETYHSPSGLKVTFGKEGFDYDKRSSKPEDLKASSDDNRSVQLPQGRQLSSFPPSIPKQSPPYNFELPSSNFRQPQPYRPFPQFRQQTSQSFPRPSQQEYSTLPKFPPISQPPKSSQSFPPPRPVPPQFHRQPVPYQTFESLRTQPPVQFRPETHFPITQSPPITQKPILFSPLGQQRPHFSEVRPQPQPKPQFQQKPAPQHQQSVPPHYQQSSLTHQQSSSQYQQSSHQQPNNRYKQNTFVSHQESSPEYQQSASQQPQYQQPSLSQYQQRPVPQRPQPVIPQHQQSVVVQHQQSAVKQHQQSAIKQHQQSISQHQQTIPHQQTISQHQQTSPQHQQTIPQHQQTIPQHQQTITQHQQTIPQHQQTISQHQHTIPQHQQTISQHQQTIPQHQQTISQHQQPTANLYQQASQLQQSQQFSPQQQQSQQFNPQHQQFNPQLSIIPAGGELIQSVPKYEQHISVPETLNSQSSQSQFQSNQQSPQFQSNQQSPQFQSNQQSPQSQFQASQSQYQIRPQLQQSSIQLNPTNYNENTKQAQSQSQHVSSDYSDKIQQQLREANALQESIRHSSPQFFNFQQSQELNYDQSTYKPSTYSTTTSTTTTTTTQKPSTTTKDPKILNAQLPDEVPDDLREQLLSSGILNHAHISVLDYDKVGDIPISALPPDQLANFFNAGGAQQIQAAGSDPVPSIAERDFDTEESEIHEVKVKPEVQMKVVKYDPETEKGQQVQEGYIKDDATQVEPVTLNDEKYNRYLPLKISGAQFPIPDVPELKGKKITSVVVLAPVAYDFSSSRQTREAKVEEIDLLKGQHLKILLKEPTQENFKKFLDKENRTKSDQQAVILLVTGSSGAVKEKEIFMYDIATQTVSKLDGELSTAFVEAAEANSDDTRASASSIVETRVPYEGDLAAEGSENVESFVDDDDLTASETHLDSKISKISKTAMLP